jgi:hypothetical protein
MRILSRCSRKRFAAVFVLAALVALAACAAPSRLEGHWRSPDAASYRIGTVLAVAAVQDSASRRLLEDRMVAEFAARGVAARPGYNWLRDGAPSSEAELGRAVSASGADSVLLISPGKVSTETVVTPGTYIAGPPMMGGFGYYGYYRSVVAPVYIPPSAYTERTISSESRLFDARSNALLWSGTARTTLTGSDLDGLTRQYASLIVGALAEDGLIR